MENSETYEHFQTTHGDPDHKPALPSNIAKKLATRSDYRTGVPTVASPEELLQYNTILKDKGKEAADKWLTEAWQSS